MEKKFGVVTVEFVLKIQKYFGLPFTRLFSNFQLIYSVRFPQFGLPFDTWHTCCYMYFPIILQLFYRLIFSAEICRL